MLSPNQLRRKVLDDNRKAASNILKKVTSDLYLAFQNSQTDDVVVQIPASSFSNRWVKQLIMTALSSSGWELDFDGEGNLNISCTNEEEDEDKDENDAPSLRVSTEKFRETLLSKYSGEL